MCVCRSVCVCVAVSPFRSGQKPGVDHATHKQVDPHTFVSQHEHERVVDPEVVHVPARGQPQGRGRRCCRSVLIHLDDRSLHHATDVGRVQDGLLRLRPRLRLRLRLQSGKVGLLRAEHALEAQFFHRVHQVDVGLELEFGKVHLQWKANHPAMRVPGESGTESQREGVFESVGNSLVVMRT